MIGEVKKYKNTNTHLHIDFGIYINADDIAKNLKKSHFSFGPYQLQPDRNELLHFAQNSGLLRLAFHYDNFCSSFQLEGKKLICTNQNFTEALAQLLASFITHQLLQAGKKISLETVFSHSSKIELIRKARDAGYKVYLYYICTESPEINIFRIKKVRVQQAGHDVPEDKIRSRYDRSLGLLYEASQMCYQAFYFDNSGDEKPFKPFAHFKIEKRKKVWDPMETQSVPSWFIQHYSSKVKPN